MTSPGRYAAAASTPTSKVVACKNNTASSGTPISAMALPSWLAVSRSRTSGNYAAAITRRTGASRHPAQPRTRSLGLAFHLPTAMPRRLLMDPWSRSDDLLTAENKPGDTELNPPLRTSRCNIAYTNSCISLHRGHSDVIPPRAYCPTKSARLYEGRQAGHRRAAVQQVGTATHARYGRLGRASTHALSNAAGLMATSHQPPATSTAATAGPNSAG